jgi:prepilin-type N-terminal cleavage/methylation domain-containing protein
MTRRLTPRTRAGFTLIELLVVIAIIATLVALTSAAVIKLFVKGDEVTTRNDISQLAAAVSSFRSERKVDYVPSRMILAESSAGWAAAAASQNKLTRDSRLYLKKLFPGIDLNGNHDWNGDGSVNSAGFVILEGDQCLVFFLGGVRGTEGFATNPRYPTMFSGTDRIRGINFVASRLDYTRGYPVYLDAWGTPFAYLASYDRENSYNRYGSPDCPTLGVSPYLQSGTKFWNPKSFQIISAGPNKVFGPGGLWGQGSLPPRAGEDDFSNFHNSKLGSP